MVRQQSPPINGCLSLIRRWFGLCKVQQESPLNGIERSVSLVRRIARGEKERPRDGRCSPTAILGDKHRYAHLIKPLEVTRNRREKRFSQSGYIVPAARRQGP